MNQEILPPRNLVVRMTKVSMENRKTTHRPRVCGVFEYAKIDLL